MSKAVNEATASMTINDILNDIQSLNKSHIDKLTLLTQLIKSNQCDDNAMSELSNDIESDINRILILDKEVIDRNNQIVVFQEKEYKIIQLLKLKQNLILKLNVSNKLVSTISSMENSMFINNSLQEFKKAKEYQKTIDEITKIITQFNNTKGN